MRRLRPLYAATLYVLATLVASGLPGAAADGAPHYKHVVIAIQENRSFDNLFAGAAAAHALKHAVRTARFGYGSVCSNDAVPVTCNRIPLVARGFEDPHDPDHSHAALTGECRHYPSAAPSRPSPCRMNGFDREDYRSTFPGPANTTAYSFLPVAEIGPYIKLANAYGLADRMFSGGLAPSFPGHMFLIAGLGPADDPPHAP